jgi:O-6-methylguanine DNA methyltransferase
MRSAFPGCRSSTRSRSWRVPPAGDASSRSRSICAARFQCAVWREIAAIPYGETRTYSAVALGAERPRAVRAAGTATGNNPVPIVIPCHRVIAAQGRLGGFSGGLDAKRRLLALERASTGELL